MTQTLHEKMPRSKVETMGASKTLLTVYAVTFLGVFN